MPEIATRRARPRFQTRSRHRAGFLLLAIVLFAVGASMLYLNIAEHYKEVIDADTRGYTTRYNDVERLRNEMHRETNNQWYYAMLLGSAICLGVWIFCPYIEHVDE
jgi:hypothetical protein